MDYSGRKKKGKDSAWRRGPKKVLEETFMLSTERCRHWAGGSERRRVETDRE